MASEITKLGAQEMYCSSCGSVILKKAEICPKCGVRNANAPAPQKTTVAKDKAVSVILAIFLGLWTWVYTYKVDAWKFWLNLALCVVTLGLWGFIAWPWAIIDTAVKPASFYKDFPA